MRRKYLRDDSDTHNANDHAGEDVEGEMLAQIQARVGTDGR